MGLVDQSKPCTQIYLQKKCKFMLAIRISKITPFGHALPPTDIQADFEINRLIRYQITAKINYLHRRQMDGQTDIEYDNNR